MSFNPNLNANVYNSFGQQIGHYNAYNQTLTLNQPISNPRNPYLQADPGIYHFPGGQIPTNNPMSPFNGLNLSNR